jgi:hypothetical protein
MRSRTVFVGLFALSALAACSDQPGPTAATAPSADAAPLPGAPDHGRVGVEALGFYRFVVPADFNGGIFGIEIDNRVAFVARRGRDGSVTGRFHYVQAAGGESFTYRGRVTCLGIYDTPVLTYFEDVPPMTQNRAKWGGIIDYSSDATIPVGTYIWFQSIDNNSGRGNHRYPDASTLSGFGDEAATEAFCNSSTVPNSKFGPHRVGSGNILVR